MLTTAGEEVGGINRAKVLIQLTPEDERALSERDFAAAMQPRLTALADMRVVFDNAFGEKDVSIALVSDDTAALARRTPTTERSWRAIM